MATHLTPMKTSFTTQLPSTPLTTPADLCKKLPCPEHLQVQIQQQRHAINGILDGHDDRLLVVLGPCSIHDISSALQYAKHLSEVSHIFSQELLLIMRVYLEKPRTTNAWKGFINDPELNGQCNINQGYHQSRELLLQIQSFNIACGTEFLNLTTPLYLGDLISWSAIGARTINSPLHRELASDLPTPVGLKNDISGNISSATDAMLTISHSQTMISTNEHGQSIIKTTPGNPYGHIILRGSWQSTNYQTPYINETQQLLGQHNLPLTRIMIDCSHGNSQKDHTQQINVAKDVCHTISQGCSSITGIMLESHLKAGRQSQHMPTLTYGQSITDACIDWETTVNVLQQCQAAVIARRQHNLHRTPEYPAANT